MSVLHQEAQLIMAKKKKRYMHKLTGINHEYYYSRIYEYHSHRPLPSPVMFVSYS